MYFFIQIYQDKNDIQMVQYLEAISWKSSNLVVIDESHNFRNGGKLYGEDK